MRFDTKSIHQGQPNDPLTGAVSFPIYQTSTYQQIEPGITKGYSYSRTENPTRIALEKAIASLENGKYGLAFSSGLGAVNTVLNLLEKNSHIIAIDDLYGGTYRIFTKLYKKFGFDFTFVDMRNVENVRNAIKKNTKIIWLKSPTNPLLKIVDIKACAQIGKENGIIVVVDNTFATPYLQKPLELGADIVLHSTTKYLNGHADVIGGALVTNSEKLYEELKFYQNAVGAVPAPLDCFLVLRGLKTLSLRMEKHCDNAEKIAEFLLNHPKIKKVYYPGLSTHKGFHIAKRQMKRFGGMVSFEVDADFENTRKFLCSLKLITLAESLGAVKSLICHPASMTHASVEPKVRIERGITDNLVRLSVGIEDVMDLLDDLFSALKKI
ncbi:PLP-dependent aspartate aminotransferase family protein [Candidatus Aminicenantes bacterium AC-335-K20]|jgi:cystathionine beta-lyase/cystathionine gamma-synthase|nr:PLP-dependent aspartate aminotransferase family protein [SCandidatus Aminicenantes bacterium Aminicenantia_JdfR_composite]MCP2597207.1 PLP-dependent aspartate aminotransferase family protein [Candidatus Aminicenantes bacterium AC-335-G13]MCP2598476.1 PLP-dependent aspartate aminotransferase family protein [Candidatus Aminicenantes bacterium AC-335-L06]MCP2619516.1 PLP-dependent aspartate aminotransferase family protein [Candidatus Aminicenantes bacterium AC-335-K20]